MSEPASKIQQALSAASSSVATAVETIIDESIEIDVETCEQPLGNRLKVIGAGGTAGSYVGHKIARKGREMVNAIPRVGPIVYAAMDASATAAGGLQGMSIANSLIENRITVCVEDAKKKAQERYEAHDFKNNGQPGEVFYLINKAIESTSESSIPNQIEREEYLSILKSKKEYYDKAWTNIMKSIASRGEDLSDENIARKKESIIKHVYMFKLGESALSAAVGAPSVSRPLAQSSSVAPPVMFSSSRSMLAAATPPRVPLGSISVPAQATAQAASSFMRNTNAGLTTRAPILSSWETISARGKALRAASSGQTAVANDASRRFDALMASPPAPVAIASSPVVSAPAPRPAPAPQPVFDQTAFVRAMFSSGGGGSGGIGISFGF